MKLIIQIPCFNEEQALPKTLSQLPREVAGFDCVEWLVVDDGSSDGTRAVALSHGVDHVVSFTRNLGLARAFTFGLDQCVRLGADVIVNTDADNQYDARSIPDIVAPILRGEADIVVGERPIASIEHFSPIKKHLQRIGSWVVRIASRTEIRDAPSGFRALSRDAALKLNVFSDYTYTLETIIQAGRKNMAIRSVPVGVNEDLRPSRLVRSISGYLKKSIATIVRILVVYRPFRFFMTLGMVILGLGLVLGLRYLYFVLTGEGMGHVQSVILSGLLLTVGFQTALIAFIADLLAVNRKLLEDVQYRIRKFESEAAVSAKPGSDPNGNHTG